MRASAVPTLWFTAVVILLAFFFVSSSAQVVADLSFDHAPASVYEDGLTPQARQLALRLAMPLPHSGGPLSGASGGPTGSPSTIPVGDFPVAVAYDPVNKMLYVSDFGSPNGTNNISVVNTTSNRVVATIPVPFGVGPLVVSGRGYVYFGGVGSTVYAISPYTNSVVSAIPLGAGCPGGCNPQPVAYDSQNGDIYVVDIGSNNVSVIHNTSLLTSIPVGAAPNGGVYDTLNDQIYIENEGGTMSIIDGSTNRVVESTPLPNPGPGVAYDPSNGDLYVCQNTNNTGNVVTVVNATTGQPIDTIPVGAACNSEAFDPANGFLYVPDTIYAPGHVNGDAIYQRNVTVIDTRTNAVVSLLPVQQAPYGIAYDAANQRVYVADAFTNNLSVLPTVFNLTFQPGSWLPSPATWTLTLANLTLWSNSSVVRFAEPDGTYTYALRVMGHPSLNTTGVVTLNGSDASIVLAQPGDATYPVTFSEVGLPGGASWSVTLTSVSRSPATGSIMFTEPNGTYGYKIADVPGWHETTLAYTGSVTVNGAAATEPTLAFIQVTYSATFAGSGLPAGTEWWVNVTGRPSLSSTSTTITLSSTNGSYRYTVSTVDKTYQAVGGSFTVIGAPISESVTFTEVTYTVTFRETGLPTGRAWSVTLNGVSSSSTTSTITFREPNGTYAFSVGVVAGYTVTPSMGNLTVRGTPVSQALLFSTTGARPSSGFLGLPGDTGYYLLGGIAILVVAGIAVALIFRGRRK